MNDVSFSKRRGRHSWTKQYPLLCIAVKVCITHYTPDESKPIIDAIALLVRHTGVPDPQDEDGQAPLHYVCKTYDTEGAGDKVGSAMVRYQLAKLFLDHQASPNVTDSKFAIPLHLAAKNGLVKLAELLIEYGADKGAKDINGHTPMDLVKEHDKCTFENVFPKTKLKKFESEFAMRDKITGNTCRVVARLVGHDWKDLYRELMDDTLTTHVETDITELEKTYVGELREQAYQSLMRWQKYYWADANIESLKRALNECELRIVSKRILISNSLSIIIFLVSAHSICIMLHTGRARVYVVTETSPN